MNCSGRTRSSGLGEHSVPRAAAKALYRKAGLACRASEAGSRGLEASNHLGPARARRRIGLGDEQGKGMRITASQIERWADSSDARGLLPVLVRRLIAATASLTELAVRGADTSNFGGWDGSVTSTDGNAWVPSGSSRWEMGCSEDVITKARGDFRTRSEDTPGETARELDFVFVSPRIWARKDEWKVEAEAAAHWRSVRAYDADDLETWLEAAGGVGLWFGELLGLQGPGVSTVQSFWDTWRSQTRAKISVEAIAAGRTAQVEQLSAELARAPQVLTVEADSNEEAVAFACAQIQALGLSDVAVCVTDVGGWRFVDANPSLRFLVAANRSVAAARAPRDGMTLIVPLNVGDRDQFAPGPADGGSLIVLERADGQAFEQALVDLGEESADAARLTRTCGRSWSVYRRLRAVNQAIRRPPWVDDASANCLTAIVLVGAWNGGRGGDIACIESVTGRRYEEVERDLLRLSHLDDAPVLRIGSVWKAKAPYELLYLFAPLLTGDQLSRFFATAQAVLTKPDPALELEPDKRWMASVYGRVRDESGIVIDSIVDSLAKLRMFGENTGNQPIMAGVDTLVGGLLEGADAQRWLSLSGVLREMAEASPEIFLRAVDNSLRSSDASIGALFTEGDGDPMFGRTLHADLLWALETLAWSPMHLGRVCDALARLMAFPVRSNLSNRPSNSLLSLLRPEWPQTTARWEQRLAVLDRLIRDHAEVAWEILTHFVRNHHSFYSANAKPHWRDYDSGALGPNQWEEGDRYPSELGARILTLAAGRADRIATLVRGIGTFEGEYRVEVLRLMHGATSFPDSERQLVRDALRHHLNWQLSFNRDNAEAMVEARALRSLFDQLAPEDLPTRHAWVYESGWVELPDGREDNHREVDAMRASLRASALEEVFQANGWPGVERLIELAGTPNLIGWQIGESEALRSDLSEWALGYLARRGNPLHDPVLRGMLHGLSPERRAAFFELFRSSTDSTVVMAVLTASPFQRSTWDFVEGLSAEVRAKYWREIQPGFLSDDGPDLLFVVDQLMEAGRHRTAFNISQFSPKSIGSARMIAILEAISAGAEPDGGQLDGYRIGEAIDTLADDESIPRRHLALLEFRYLDALESRKGAKILFAEMTQDADFFIELVCLAFRPKDVEEEPSGAHPSAISNAWSVLHHGRGVPGMQAAGAIDSRQFFAWVDRVRSLAREKGRSDVADVVLGGWLSRCPAEAGGSWPCVPVRELLEDLSADAIRRGFHTGVYNNRGVHSRAMLAGGAPERSLADHYRALAQAVCGAYPQTAATLESLARGYDSDARWHDNDAALMRES